MTEVELRHFKQRLLELKKRSSGVLTGLEEEALRPVGGEAAGGLSDVPVHPADLAADNYEEEVSLDLLESESMLLAEIEDALRRIEVGTYGRCARCHQEIPRARLEAVPYTRYCIRCARELQERSNK